MKVYLVAMNYTGIVFTPYSHGYDRDPQWANKGDILHIPVSRVKNPDAEDEQFAYAEVAYKLYLDDVDRMGKSGLRALWIVLRVHPDHDLLPNWTRCGWQAFSSDHNEAVGYSRAMRFMQAVQARWTLRSLYDPAADPIFLLGTS